MNPSLQHESCYHNSREALEYWVGQTLADSKLGAISKAFAQGEAQRLILRGHLRGAISNKWKQLGFDTLLIPGMFS